MKASKKKPTKTTLSDKIADSLTVKPSADIEDDQVFGTKPKTLSQVDFDLSNSEDEALISDFRKRNINLLSDLSKKYEGEVVSSKNKKINSSEDSDDEVCSDADLPRYSASEIISHDSENSDSQNRTLEHNKSNLVGSESEDESESDDYSIMGNKKMPESEGDSEDESVNGDMGEGYDISQMEEPMAEGFEHMKKQNVSEEVKKGICVKNQLLLWEGLLELRIHLQRCMNTANQMPMPDTYEELKQSNEFMEECNAAKANVAIVLDKFLQLQNTLLKKFPETTALCPKAYEKKSVQEQKPINEGSDEEIPSDTEDEEIPSDTEEDDSQKEVKIVESKENDNKGTTSKKRKLEDYAKELEISHKAFKTFRDSTIQKWNDKTRLITSTNIKNAQTNSVLQQISYILSDKDKLLKRTQLKRSDYEIVGYKKQINEVNKDPNVIEENPIIRDKKDNDEYIPEIFDDSDFYHQLLRELIECKSADVTDPIQLSRQWIALQQMRSKMKRKVDTKATKGRRIKYVVHNKLVNFMGPEKNLTWTDEATNELYSSLFGKMYENNSNMGLNSNNVENGLKIVN